MLGGGSNDGAVGNPKLTRRAFASRVLSSCYVLGVINDHPIILPEMVCSSERLINSFTAQGWQKENLVDEPWRKQIWCEGSLTDPRTPARPHLCKSAHTASM